MKLVLALLYHVGCGEKDNYFQFPADHIDSSLYRAAILAMFISYLIAPFSIFFDTMPHLCAYL